MTQEPPEPVGHLRPTSGAALAIFAVLGLVGGWSVRPIAVRLDSTTPLVTWTQAFALVFVAAILAYLTWHTWQTIHVHGRRLEGNRAVNRLVLARACALVGALAAGGYAGHGISWLGSSAELAGERMIRCAVAAAAGLLVMGISLLLERACRVPSSGSDP